jgi:hypothetical protein
MKPLDERSFAFVVRVWEERRDLDGAPPTWRCSIDDVQSGARVYFESVAHACVFLRAHSGSERTEVEDDRTGCVARVRRPARRHD